MPAFPPPRCKIRQGLVCRCPRSPEEPSPIVIRRPFCHPGYGRSGVWPTRSARVCTSHAARQRAVTLPSIRDGQGTRQGQANRRRGRRLRTPRGRGEGLTRRSGRRAAAGDRPDRARWPLSSDGLRRGRRRARGPLQGRDLESAAADRGGPPRLRRRGEEERSAEPYLARLVLSIPEPRVSSPGERSWLDSDLRQVARRGAHGGAARSGARKTAA